MAVDVVCCGVVGRCLMFFEEGRREGGRALLLFAVALFVRAVGVRRVRVVGGGLGAGKR